MRPTIVAVIGGINMDLLMHVHRTPDVGKSMDALSLAHLPGGKGANTAIAAYRTSRPKPSEGNAAGGQGTTSSAAHNHNQRDVKVYMNGAVGEDHYGTELRTRLTENGINVAGVRTIPGVSTNLCVVLVETENGGSRNVGYPAANLHWALLKPGSLASLGDGLMP